MVGDWFFVRSFNEVPNIPDLQYGHLQPCRNLFTPVFLFSHKFPCKIFLHLLMPENEILWMANETRSLVNYQISFSIHLHGFSMNQITYLSNLNDTFSYQVLIDVINFHFVFPLSRKNFFSREKNSFKWIGNDFS